MIKRKIFSISTEVIDTQIEDKAIDKINIHFENIIRLIDFYRIKSGLACFKNENIKKEYEAIDKILYERFKLKFKHVFGSTAYAILPLKLDKASALQEDAKEAVDALRKYSEMCNKDPKCKIYKDTDTIYNSDNIPQALSILKKTYSNIKSLEKTLGGKGLKVDFEKATITGFNQEEPIFIMCDPFLLFNYINLSPKEATAILLHEIGHAFTFISTGYREVKQTTLLVESFINTVSKEDRLKSFNMYLKKNYNKELKGDSYDATVIVDLVKDKLLDPNINNVLAYSDSEQQADQFVARFGLGIELSVGLHKVNKLITDNSISTLPATIIVNIEIIFMLFIFFSLTGVGIFILIICLKMITEFIVKVLSGTTYIKETVYDDNEDRLRRIKQDIIRQIRTAQVPNSNMKKYIDAVEYLTTITRLYANEKSIIFSLGNLAPWNIDKYVMTRMQKLIENTSENELHVAKNKLELLI